MRTLASFALVSTALLALSCRQTSQRRALEYMPDMVRDPAFKAFAPNPVTRDRLTLQPAVAGTIPRGYVPFHYGPGEGEAIRAGKELLNPFSGSPDTLRQGRALFETYCMICHGPEGKGDGPLAGKIPSPPSYTSDRLLSFPAGRIYHVITMGSGKMPSYAPQLTAAERWKVVTYIRRSLQHLDGSHP